MNKANHSLDVVGVFEAAQILGVSKQRVSQLMRAGNLPAPAATLRATPVWHRYQIEAALVERLQSEIRSLTKSGFRVIAPGGEECASLERSSPSWDGATDEELDELSAGMIRGGQRGDSIDLGY